MVCTCSHSQSKLEKVRLTQADFFKLLAFTNSKWRRLVEDPDMAVNTSTQGENGRLKTEGNTRKSG